MAAIWLFVALGYLLLYVFAAVPDAHVQALLPAAASAERSQSSSLHHLLPFDYAMNPLQFQLRDQLRHQNWQGSSLPASCIASAASVSPADGFLHRHEVPAEAVLDAFSLSHVW